MATKASLLGVLMYAAMAAYGGAAFAHLRSRRGLGQVLSGLAFVLLLAAVSLRVGQTGRVPLQNLFEVFLCLAMVAWPVSMLCGRLLRAPVGAADAALGLLVLFPAAVIFDAVPQPLPPVLQNPLFGPHVGAYVLGYFVMFKAAAVSARGLAAGRGGGPAAVVCAEGIAFRLVRFGFPLLTLGLVLGSLWGKLAWGDYWNWDPKELWGLAMWLLYLAYFQFRAHTRAALPRTNCALVLLGAAAIVITLSWVNLSRLFAGLHSYAM
jgi:ABC-type transport system involved in cytochrome c biogenesis permease subunit